MSVNSKMTAIADAIRAKTGGTAALTLDGMAQAIAAIEAGGGGGFPNGTEWTQSNVTSYIYDVAFHDNGFWVAFGNNTAYYSTDGINWNAATGGPYGTTLALPYRDAIIVAAYGKGIYRTTDGKNWTKNLSSYSTSRLACSSSNVVATDENRLYTSSDGKSWKTVTLSGSGYSSCIAYADGLWLAGYSGKLYYSTDAATWTLNDTVSFTARHIFNDCGFWVAATDNGLYYSSDGMSWTQSNITSAVENSQPTGNTWHGNGVWMHASNIGLYRSTDGMNWVASKDFGSYDAACVAESNGVWVSCSVNGGSTGKGMAHSTDNGATWTFQDLRIYANSVCNANGIWVAATSHGIYYSPTWQPTE